MGRESVRVNNIFIIIIISTTEQSSSEFVNHFMPSRNNLVQNFQIKCLIILSTHD